MARTMQDYIRYANQGAKRNLPLSDEMQKATKYLADMGITMEVFSGGQEKGVSNGTTGGPRHNHGNAADVFFYKDGRKLDWGNKEDIPIFQAIVKQGRANGLTGFGAGPGYMQQGSMHIGLGSPAVWGHTTRSDSAPDWLNDAFEGRVGGEYATPAPVQVASVADVYQAPAELPFGAQMMSYAPQEAAQTTASVSDAFVAPDNKALSMASPATLATQQVGTVQSPSPAPVVGPPPVTTSIADLFPTTQFTPTLGTGMAPEVQVAEGMVSPLAPPTAAQGLAEAFGPSSTPMAAAMQSPAAAPGPQSVSQIFGGDIPPDGTEDPDYKPTDIPGWGVLAAGAGLGLGAALWPGMDAAEAERVRRIGSIGGVTKVPDSVRRLTSG